ncbi:MAG: hypothetical protein WD045_02120 [Pirellulaceae bacterium]
MGSRLRLGLLLLGFTAMLASTASAQQSILPGPRELPADLLGHLELLREQQLHYLKQFSEYAEARYQAGEVPKGIALHAQAYYKRAQLQHEQDPAKRKELTDEMVKLTRVQQELDTNNPQQTWFGVDKLRLGGYLRVEWERFRQELPDTPE